MVFVAALIVGTGHQLVDNGLIEGPAPNSLRVSVDKLKDALETSIDAVDFEYESVARTNEESEAIDRHVAQDRLDRLADGLETEESTANPELAEPGDETAPDRDAVAGPSILAMIDSQPERLPEYLPPSSSPSRTAPQRALVLEPTLDADADHEASRQRYVESTRAAELIFRDALRMLREE
jgi:hypothetical protein